MTPEEKHAVDAIIQASENFVRINKTLERIAVAVEVMAYPPVVVEPITKEDFPDIWSPEDETK